MSYTIKDAEWTCDKTDCEGLYPFEEFCGFELCLWFDVLELKGMEDACTYEKDLGEIYRAYADDDCRCLAWSAMMNLYKVFENFDEATKWVERMTDYRLRGEWPEEIPNYEVLKTIQKLQGVY